MEWSMAGKEKKTKKTLNRNDPTNMPRPASENTGDRRARAVLQTSSLTDLSFPFEVVIIRTKRSYYQQ